MLLDSVNLESDRSLVSAELAIGFAVLILATLVTEFEVVGEDKLLIWVKVHPVLNVLIAEKLFSVAIATLKAIWTLPVAVRHLN